MIPGRQGESSSINLANNLKKYGLKIDRYQTATLELIKIQLILKILKEITGSINPRYFSYFTEKRDENL